MKCIPCLVSYEGFRYRIYADGRVCGVPGARRNDPTPPGASYTDAVWDPSYAREIIDESRRQRRNRRARQRHQAMQDLGLVRAPGGAFGGYE